MKAGFYTMKIEQGVSFLRVLVCRDANRGLTDLSSSTVTMAMRETVSSPNIIATSVGEDANINIVVGGVDGRISISMTVETTAAFSFDSAVYDIDLTDESGTVTRLFEGNVILLPKVPR